MSWRLLASLAWGIAPNGEQVDPPEFAALLRRCAREGRWGALVRALARPPRMRIADLWARFRGGGERGRWAFSVALEGAPPLTGEVPALHHGGPPGSVDAVTTLRLRADIDAQLLGVVRLAGGAVYRLDPSRLGSLGDYEAHHAYHRLYWALRYAQGAALGHRRAEVVRALDRELGAWLHADWSADPKIAQAYTVAERIITVAELLFWIDRGPLSEVRHLVLPLKRVMWRDAAHLAENLELVLGVHNHLLTNARALWLASALLPEAPAAPAWRDRAFLLWEDQFPHLLLEDGSFREGSSFYALMHCRTALDLLCAFARESRALPAGLRERIEGYFAQGDALVRADGSLPRFGNISPDHVVEDLWGVLTAAYLLGAMSHAPRHAVRSPVTAWYVGGEAHPSPGESPRESPHVSARPEREEERFVASGWGFLRRPGLGVELAVHGDPRPRTPGHGDAGRGSFELWHEGRILVREPGNVSYVSAGRHRYRAGGGQNVTCLDGVAAGISEEYQDLLPGWYTDVQQGEWGTHPGGLEFRTTGHSRLGEPLAIARRWSWEGERTLLLTEEITGTGTRHVASRLHLGDADWERRGATAWRLAAGEVSMDLLLPPELIAREARARFAPEYGVEREGRAIIVEGSCALPCRWSVSWTFGAPDLHRTPA